MLRVNYFRARVSTVFFISQLNNEDASKKKKQFSKKKRKSIHDNQECVSSQSIAFYHENIVNLTI